MIAINSVSFYNCLSFIRWTEVLETDLTLGNRCQYPGWIFPSNAQVHLVYNYGIPTSLRPLVQMTIIRNFNIL